MLGRGQHDRRCQGGDDSNTNQSIHSTVLLKETVGDVTKEEYQYQ